MNLFVAAQLTLSSFSKMHLYDSFTSARYLPYQIRYQRGASTTEERAWVFCCQPGEPVAFEDLLECLCKKQCCEPKFFCSLPTSLPLKEVYNGEPAFYELYRERQLLSCGLGCGHFQLFATSAFKTHLESHLVLLSDGWRNCIWFPPSFYRKEILQFPTWFLTSNDDLFNEGTVINWFVPG